MLNYLRRLLGAPGIFDVVIFLVIECLTPFINLIFWFAGPYAFGLGMLPMGLGLWLISGSWEKGVTIAACAEVAVFAVICSASRTDDDITWPLVATIATLMGIAVLHEQITHHEE